MKVALAQLNYIIGDFDGNARKIVHSIEKAKTQGADLIVFSELSVTGYYPHDLLEKKEFVLKAEKTVLKVAEVCSGIAAVVGAPQINEKNKGKALYNAAYFLAEGRIQSVHKKTLLPTYDVFDEYRHFEPNSDFQIVQYKGKRIAITICEDLWDEQPTSNEFGRKNIYRLAPMEQFLKLEPDLVVNISASPFSYNQENWRKEVLIAKAKKYNVPIVYVNQTGAQTELIFDGGSVFINNHGEIIRELMYFKEDFQVVDIDDPGGVKIQPKSETIRKIYDALVLGIRDYFVKMKFKKGILGLSSGIESAVVLALAVDALGNDNVRVLLLPSKYSSTHSIVDARKLAENLKVQYDMLPIQAVVDQNESALRDIFKDTTPDIAEENIQARTRGTLLMAVSNKFGNILLNTTNKSECAVGYGTLYGDMNGGLAVLADVYKTDVYRLAHFINRDKEIIPVNSIVKPPSAELRPDQKDSDSLPEYELLDELLFSFIEQNLTPEEIISKGFEASMVHHVVKMVNINEYKRFQAPPVLRVSSKAFGFGRKIPLVAKF